MAWTDAARAAAAEVRRMHKALQPNPVVVGKHKFSVEYLDGRQVLRPIHAVSNGRVKLGTSVKLSGSKPVSKRQAARNKKYMEQRNRRIANGTY